MKEFLKNNWFTILVVLGAVVLAVMFSRSCSRNEYLESELARYENNLKAANDSLKNYKDGVYQCAEMRAMQLRIDELADSLKLERGKEPITIIRYVAGITDTVYVDGDIIHDTVNIYGGLCDRGVVSLHKDDKFVKSSRSLDVSIPYTIDSSCNMDIGESMISVSQNIWLDATLYVDKKGETFVRLKTDYPNTTFNDGTAISLSNAKSDKNKHFGVCIGATVGYGVAITNNGALSASPAPYVGLGVTIGWQPNKLRF